MVMIIKEDFNGVDGADWDSATWTADQNTGTSISDINTNRGRIIAQGGAGVTGAKHTIKVFGPDAEVIATIRRVSGSVEQYSQISMRGDGLIGSSLTAYYLQFSQTALTVNKRIAGTGTLIATSAAVLAADTTYWVRFQVHTEGATNRVRVKYWADGSVEPAAWTVTGTDNAINVAGQTRLTHGNGADSVARTAYWDLFSVSTGPRIVKQDVGTTANTTGASTTAVDLAAGASLVVGNYLILRVAVDNSGASGAAPGLTVTDARNTWTVLGPALNDPVGASAGIAGYVAYCRIANAYSNGDDVTLTWGTGSPAAKACVIDEWAGLKASSVVAVSAVTASGAASPATASIQPTATDQLVYVAVFVEGETADTYTGDADFTDGSWGTLTRSGAGTAAAGAVVNGQYKRTTGVNNQSYSAALGTARDWASLAVVFAPLVPLVTGTGTGSFGFTGSANGDVKVEGSATGIFGFSGPATADVIIEATASGIFGFAGAAAGDVEVEGLATGIFGFVGAAEGDVTSPPNPPVPGAATGIFGFVGAAAGDVEVVGSGAGAFGFTGAAVGEVAVDGTAVGAFGFSGAATGDVTVLADANGAFGFAGAADAVVVVPGAATGVFGFDGTAVGDRAVDATATGLFGFSGPAVSVRSVDGTAVGTFGFSGAGDGVRSFDGSAVGAFGFSGAAAGEVVILSAALGLFGFTGSAAGVVTGVGLGSADGHFGFSGDAVGGRAVFGSAVGSYALAGLVDGEVHRAGAAAGVYGFVATATGLKVVPAVAVALLGFQGQAVAARDVYGTAVGVLGFQGPAEGIAASRVYGEAVAIFGFDGVALGFVHLIPTGDGLGIVPPVTFPRVRRFDGFGQVPADTGIQVVR